MKYTVMGIYNFEEFNEKRIKESDESLHKEMMDTMRVFMDNGKPKVGIFWFDYINNTLFGVQKDDADKYADDKTIKTYPKLHKTYWQKQHHRAVAKNDVDSIFYKEHNYTLIPRGRVFVRPDGTFYVTVGSWFNGMIDGKKVFDPVVFKELVEDEFNLPDDFEFVVDKHWELGHGWSEEMF